MNKNRLEAFSDGVLAIIITIMILDLKIPHNPTFSSYLDTLPVFLSYALSFVFVALYWNTHHYLFATSSKINNNVVWWNMFVLFWQSLIPFVTGTMGENSFSSITVSIYAIVLAISTTAHIFLVNSLCKLHGAGSEFSKHYKGHFRNYVTISVNLSAAIIAGIGFPKIAFTLMVLTAILWFLPNHKNVYQS